MRVIYKKPYYPKFIEWIFKLLPCQIRERLYRKPKVRIDGWDIWSADYTLSFIILPILERIKTKKHGTPSGFDTWEEYEAVLDEMIFSFREISLEKPGWRNCFTHYGDMQFNPIEDKNGEIYAYEITDYGCDCDTDRLAEYESKLQRGFDLFGKYYQTLWT